MTETLIKYTQAFYQKLMEHAETEKHGEVLVHVFRGKVGEVYRELKISQSYYSKIRRALISSGSITITQQGARGHSSIIYLHHAPEREVLISQKDLTRRVDVAILAQRVTDIEKRLGGLNLTEALINIERRLRDVELEISRSQQKQSPTRKGDNYHGS